MLRFINVIQAILQYGIIGQAGLSVYTASTKKPIDYPSKLLFKAFNILSINKMCLYSQLHDFPKYYLKCMLL